MHWPATRHGLIALCAIHTANLCYSTDADTRVEAHSASLRVLRTGNSSQPEPLPPGATRAAQVKIMATSGAGAAAAPGSGQPSAEALWDRWALCTC